MRRGTKSLLFGAHQFIIHPLFVLYAWKCNEKTYPNWKELVCILIHDWGYWGKSEMDSTEGEKHVEWAARVTRKWWGSYYGDLCLLHSRHYARNLGEEPSKLCWADKLGVALEPWWLYIPRAILSGEIYEYRKISEDAELIGLEKSHREWFTRLKVYMKDMAKERRSNHYCNKPRGRELTGRQVDSKSA